MELILNSTWLAQTSWVAGSTSNALRLLDQRPKGIEFLVFYNLNERTKTHSVIFWKVWLEDDPSKINKSKIVTLKDGLSKIARLQIATLKDGLSKITKSKIVTLKDGLSKITKSEVVTMKR